MYIYIYIYIHQRNSITIVSLNVQYKACIKLTGAKQGTSRQRLYVSKRRCYHNSKWTTTRLSSIILHKSTFSKQLLREVSIS